MKYTDEQLDWTKAVIKPELPEYDDKDHELAKLRFVINEMYEEIVDIWGNLYIAHDRGETLDGAKAYEQLNWFLHKSINEQKELGAPDGTEQEEIDRYAESRRWEMWKKTHADDYHCGDCTSVACSCAKCHAEQFYMFSPDLPKPPVDMGSHPRHSALSIYQDYQSNLEEGTKS